jgi:tetratricopeptide (TPR) repeat protein
VHARARTSCPGSQPDFFGVVLEAVNLVQTKEMRREVLSRVAEEQARSGQWEQALLTLSYHEFSDQLAVKIAHATAGAQLGQEGFAKLLEVIIKLDDPHRRAWAQAEIATAQASAGAAGAAKKTLSAALTDLESIKDVGWRDLVLGSAAKAQVAVGAFVDAITTTRSITSPERRVQGFAAIGVAQACAGQRDQASMTLSEADRVANREIDWDPIPRIPNPERFKALGGLAIAYAHITEFDRALKIVERMCGDYGDSWEAVKALACIAMAQTEVGQAPQATFMQATSLVANKTFVFNREGEELLAVAKAKAGLYEEAVYAAETVVTRRSYALPVVARAMVERGLSNSSKNA